MGRTIITPADVRKAKEEYAFSKPLGVVDQDAGGPSQQVDSNSFREKLYKYIPSEVIALYLGTTLVLKTAGSEAPPILGWVLFVVGLVGTWIYLRSAQGVTKPKQLSVSVGAFGVWVFSLGGPFEQLAWYHPFYGALLLPIYTFAAATIDP